MSSETAEFGINPLETFSKGLGLVAGVKKTMAMVDNKKVCNKNNSIVKYFLGTANQTELIKTQIKATKYVKRS